MELDKKTLRYFTSSITQSNNATDYSQRNKEFWFNFYMDMFFNLATNLFVYDDMPNTVDTFFIENKLFLNGYVAFMELENEGIYAQNGTFGNRLDLYDMPMNFSVVNNSTFLSNLLGVRKQYFISWRDNNLTNEEIDSITGTGVKFKTEKDKRLKSCVVMGNTNRFMPFYSHISTFCEKLAMIEQTIQLNRNAQIKPFVIATTQEQQLTFKNFFAKLFNGDPVIYLKKQKNTDNIEKPTQLKDMIEILDIAPPNILADLNDEKQRVIAQLLTVLGINNNMVDKKERLVKSEATSNNGLIEANIQVRLTAREKGIKRFNEFFGENASVRVNENIMMYNTDIVNEQINKEIDDITEINE